MRDFFISYTKYDRAWAEWVAWNLEDAGYTTVLQVWDFPPGSNGILEMDRAVTNTFRLLAILSPEYLSARFTLPEFAAAFASDPTGTDGALIPIRIRECEPIGLLKQITWIDLVDLDESDAKNTLLAGVAKIRGKPARRPRFPGASATRPQFPGPQSSQVSESSTRNESESDVSSPNAGGRAVAVTVDVGLKDVELVIDRNFDDYGREDQERLLSAIRELLKIKGNLSIKRKRRGSIRLTIELDAAQADTLLWSARMGVLGEYGVTDVIVRDHTMKGAPYSGVEIWWTETRSALLGGLHIVVVEHDYDMRERLRQWLAHAGALVTTASDSDAALTVLRNVVADAVITELVMPRHDGAWLVRNLRAFEGERGRTPTIAIIGDYDSQLESDALDEGFDAYLEKPFGPRRLLETILRFATPSGPASRPGGRLAGQGERGDGDITTGTP